MVQSPSALRRTLHRRSRRAAAAVLTTAVAATGLGAGLAAAPAAGSAATAECPLAYPVSSVTKGQQVTGRTVTSGTEPTGFTGEVVGVIRDGIAPGLDMVMARLSSPEIDRVGGIWQGMSGSPVYAADGRLVGAVAYGLAWGPSPVAGITPAEEMYRLLDDAPTGAGSARTLRAAAERDAVDVPPRLLARVAEAGAVSTDQAGQGMRRLPVPFGISGMLDDKRLAQAKKAFGLSGVRVHQSGATSASAAPVGIVAGGNLAASVSYGDLSTIGVGTATAVCGDQVLAFGHPMMFTGPSRMSLHGADALYVQEDSLGAPFKVANAGAPIGSITQDRLAGLFGLQGADAVPDTAQVTSYVEVPGEWSRTGTTWVSVPDAVPDMAAFHVLADQDRVFDAYGQGSARASWTVTGTRAGGRPFTFTRQDRFASEYDISFETIWDLYDQLAQLRFNDIEDVTLDRISTTSTMERAYRAYTIRKVRVLDRGRWHQLRTDRPLVLRGGTVKRFRVLLSSPDLGAERVRVSLPVPARIGHKSGYLEIVGGNSYWGSENYFEEEFYLGGEETGPETFEGLLHQLRTAPRNDQVLANLTLYRRTGTPMQRMGRTGTPAVVNGMVGVEVQGLPAR